ncbi:MAG TPA: hypothetical protein VFI31_10285 [Pirellulales bacterium]|nr:hypothetical protein [Pirellulales bacterium]
MVQPETAVPVMPAERDFQAPDVAVAEHVEASPPIDEDRIAARRIRKVEGQRLTLFTDVPVEPAVEELPEVFALAVPEWCRYFGIEEKALADWVVRGCLMKDRERFEAAGLLPKELEFVNGFTRDNEIWWREQETGFYRRHLMLHEGTHSLMFAHFRGCGPAWYMEAVAELLGTHRLNDGRLTLGYFPARPDDVPFWGRIKIVQDAVRAGQARSLVEILNFPPDAHLRNDTYGWCWAIAAFLDGHPRYRERFRKLPGEVRENDFNDRFLARFADDWALLNIEWQVFIHELDYGYDFQRNAIDVATAEPLDDTAGTVRVAADGGWQASGFRLEPDVRYQLAASGRYQLADEPKIWWSEPDGVTIRYYRGHPLGMLLAMVFPDEQGETTWPQPVAVGAHGQITSDVRGTLYFRINDSPGELADNAGSLDVTVERSHGGK